MKQAFLKGMLRIAILYLGIIVLAYLFQSKLIYHPDKHLKEPDIYGLSMEKVALITPDRVWLTAWYQPAQDAMPTIIYYHGNAGNLSHRTYKYKAFTDAGYGLLALSYRGYGTSEGTPSEQGLYMDARTAINFIKQYNILEQQIILYGESLGSGVAVQMATEIDAKLLALETPFTSLMDAGQYHYPYLPVKWLSKEHFDSLSKIKQVTEPLIIFHGKQDQIIPVEQATTLYNAAQSRKHMVYYDNTGHNDQNIHNNVKEITEFLGKH